MGKIKTYGKLAAVFLAGAFAQSQFPIWSEFVSLVSQIPAMFG